MKNIKRIMAVVMVIVMIFTMIPFSVFATDTEFTPIALNEEIIISGTGEELSGKFSFAPENDGSYLFYSTGYGLDPYCQIYDAEGNLISDNDDGGEELNFCLSVSLSAEQTYYLHTYCHEIDQYGSYTVSVIVAPKASEIQLEEKLYGVVGQGASLEYRFLPNGCLYEAITFKSSDENIATVNDQGYVQYIGAGTATITATTESGLTDTCTVFVLEHEKIEVGTIYTKEISASDNIVCYKFTPDWEGYFGIYVESDCKFNYILSYDGYKTSGEYGYIEEDLYILDLQYGANNETDYYLIVYSEEPVQQGQISITVNKIPYATAMSIECLSEGYIGDNLYAVPVFYPEGSYNEGVTWSSDNSDIVYVSEGGNIELLAVGSATITATSVRGLTATKTITVKDYESIAVNEEKIIDSNYGYKKVFKFMPEESGSYKFYSYNNDGDSKAYLYDSELNEIAQDDDSGTDNNFIIIKKLEAGKTYYFAPQFYTYGPTTEGVFYTKVEKVNAISEITITAYPNKMDYYEGRNEFSYDGLALELIYEDGTKVDWVYGRDDIYFGDYYVRIYDEFDEDGNYLNSIIECGDVEPVTFSFNIVENPVRSITLISGTQTKYIENTNGYYTTVYDEETDSQKEVFIYYAYSGPSDAKIRIDYKNSTSVYANVYDYVDGEQVEWYNNQYEEPWTVGNNNKSTISYLGHTVNLPITVIKNPVDSIEVVSGSITVVENCYGYWEGPEDDKRFIYYANAPEDLIIKVNFTDGTSKNITMGEKVEGYWPNFDSNQSIKPWVLGDDNYAVVEILGKKANVPVSVIKNDVEEIVIDTAPTRRYIYGDSDFGYPSEEGYWFYPTDLSGIVFTVYYTDGTNKQYTYSDLEEDYGEYYLNGYMLEFNFDDELVEAGTHRVKLIYKGASDTYNVVLEESIVESLDIISNPNKTEFKNGYIPDFIGTKIQINYTDGTSEIVEITSDNLIFYVNEYSGYYERYVLVNGLKLYVDKVYDEYDNYVYRFSCLDATIYCDSLTFTNEKIESIELDNLSKTGEDMLVTITYNDGTSEVLELENIWYLDFDGIGCFGVANTSNGMLEYYIEMICDDNGEPEEYYVYILEESITVSLKTVISGDVDCDGIVGTTDLAVLKLYLAGATELEGDSLTAGDLDGDGDVETTDLATLKLMLAGAI